VPDILGHADSRKILAGKPGVDANRLPGSLNKPAKKVNCKPATILFFNPGISTMVLILHE